MKLDRIGQSRLRRKPLRMTNRGDVDEQGLDERDAVAQPDDTEKSPRVARMIGRLV